MLPRRWGGGGGGVIQDNLEVTEKLTFLALALTVANLHLIKPNYKEESPVRDR